MQAFILDTPTTSPHSYARLVADVLANHNIECQISTDYPADFSSFDVAIICADLQEKAEAKNWHRCAEELLQRSTLPYILIQKVPSCGPCDEIFHSLASASHCLGCLGKPFSVADLSRLLSTLEETAAYKKVKSRHNKPKPDKPLLLNIEPQDMLRAIAQGALVAYYQPIYSLATRQVKGFEALARWQHHQHGWLTPDQFWTTLESPLCGWPIAQIMMHQMFAWASHPLNEKMHLSFSINLPSHLEALHALPDEASAMAKFMGVNMMDITFEVPSSIFHPDDDLPWIISRLRTQGFRCAMDQYTAPDVPIKWFNAMGSQKIKIHPSRVASIGRDEQRQSDLAQLIEQALTQKIEIIAMGVETKEQVEFLVEHGCSLAQGYYFCKPLSIEDFKQLMVHEKHLRFGP